VVTVVVQFAKKKISQHSFFGIHDKVLWWQPFRRQEKYGAEVRNPVTLYHCSVQYEPFSDLDESNEYVSGGRLRNKLGNIWLHFPYKKRLVLQSTVYITHSLQKEIISVIRKLRIR
jgi:hypothetical protein